MVSIKKILEDDLVSLEFGTGLFNFIYCGGWGGVNCIDY
jgi:hypothetical protein